MGKAEEDRGWMKTWGPGILLLIPEHDTKDHSGVTPVQSAVW